MPRHQIPKMTLALLTLLALGAAALSINTEGTSSHSKGPMTSHPRLPIGSPAYGFGGYQLYPAEPVTSVSAEWTVPTISTGSSAGDASTWIGVQSQSGAFSQVGTVENRYSNGNDQYYAFWSDTAKGFRPLNLLGVKPGDSVTAKMTLKPEGWSLALDDATSGKARTIQTKYGADDQFNSCEWFQENPVYSQFDHTNYPALSTVTFRHMALNHSKPTFNFQEAQTLSTYNDTFFVPTHVKRDQFSLVPATGSALAFLTDVYIEDQLGADFFESATQGIEPGNITTNSYIAGLGLELPILQAESWPKHVAKAMSRYIANQNYLETYMQKWLDEPPSERSGNLSNVANALLKADHYADKVRSLLGLPPVYG
jgi:Peptidase A4 family